MKMMSHASVLFIRLALSSVITLILADMTSMARGDTPATNASYTPDPSWPYFNTNLPIDQRVDDLIRRMTVAEKISQLMRASPAIPRLGVLDFLWANNAPHGVARRGTATVFPQAIALAATWNPDLNHAVARAIATEVWAKNNQRDPQTPAERAKAGEFNHLSIWSPNINIVRDPRWGRGQETYGEDPFLTSRFGIAFVTGLQGDDPHYLQTIATVKHFDAHSGPESQRTYFNAVVSERDFHETYLPAFEACVREGHAAGVMSSYNAINGVPAPANHRLLTEILRDEWGFGGAVVGDTDAVACIWRAHHYAKDAAEASALAIRAGNDLCSGITYQALPESLQRGLVTEADLNQALHRLYRLRFRLGQFDPPERVPFTKIPFSELDSPKHEQLALEASRQSLVLLKNDGTLPWDPKTIKNLAILGPTGDDQTALIGNYAGTPARPVNLVDGLRKKLEPLGVKVSYERTVPLVEGYNVAGDPIPASAFFTDQSMSKAGLSRAIYADSDFMTQSGVPGTDAQIKFFWNETQPVTDIPITKANVRWTGFLVPSVSGDHILSVSANSVFVLKLDGHTFLENNRPKYQVVASKMVTLQAGHPYKLTLDYVQTTPDGKITLGWVLPGAESGLERGMEAAKQADHIVLTLGITSDLESESMKVDATGFSGGDRTSILLPKIQRDLIDQVAALGKPFVVVLTNGSALSFDTSKPNAILEAWYYGEQGGNAVAETLLGECNPGGRLPITFYKSDADLPSFTDYSMANRTYRYFNGTPLYAFGHGLSYTTFSEDHLALSAAEAKRGDTLELSMAIKNTGSRVGDDVVEVYARAVKPPVPMPQQWLVGFQRVSLTPGETKTVTIPVRVEALRRYDETLKSYVVDPGNYELHVGPSSDQLPLMTNLQISQ
jgi:beta-glucosidase